MGGISSIITVGCSRCINTPLDGRQTLFIQFSLKEAESGIIKPYHVHSHDLLRPSVAFALNLELSQVAIVNIQKISDGILVLVKLKFLNQEDGQKLTMDLQGEVRHNLR